MDVYKKMYFTLFHAMTDALVHLEEADYGQAGRRLRRGQQEAEELLLAEEAGT